MKEQLKDLIPLWNEAKKKALVLENEDFELYKKHKLFENLELTNKEIIENILSLKKIILDEEECKKNKNKCSSESNYHLFIKRNKNNKLVLFVYYCPKMELLEKKSLQKNFLYNYYRDSSLSNVKLSGEYFQKRGDKSLQMIIDNYQNKIKNNSLTHGMYIYGGFGIGKTHLSFAFANDLAINKNYKICFVFLPEYINIIKKSFNNEELKDYVDKLTNTFKEIDLLFIDDIGSENSSEWFYTEYFLNILNQRMHKNKLTFFNSNLSLNELEKNLEYKFKNSGNSKIAAARIMDRIRTLVANTDYLLKGNNKRY